MARLPLWLISLVATTLIISFCSSCSSSSQQTDPLISEARLEAEKFWASKFAKCEDSYYGSVDVLSMYKHLYQLREPTLTIVPLPVTEADKLNSIEWLGMTSFIPRVYRLNIFKAADQSWTGWTSWYDGNLKDASSEHLKALPLTAVLGKRKRGWDMMLASEDKSDITKPTCDELPKK